MNDLLKYLIESAVSLCLFYGIYWMFLRKDTYFVRNRFYLMLTIFLSMVIPSLTISVPQPTPIYTIETMLDSAVIVPASSFSTQTGNSPRNLLSWFYIAGAGFFFFKFLFNTGQVFWLIRKNGIIQEEGIRIVYLERNISPFSFYNIIFLNRSLMGQDAREKIIAHEMNHIRKRHTVDLVIFEALTIVQWFNPVAWLYKWSLKEVHEYQADEAVIRSGHNLLNYQELVLSQVFGNQFFQIAHNLNQSLIKKRIIMMKRFKSSKGARYKVFLALPAAFLIIALFSFNSNSPGKSDGATPSLSQELSLSAQKDTTVFFSVDTMPTFQGGDLEKFRRYLSLNIKYPGEAKEKNIHGTVYVQFVVNQKGQVVMAEVVRGVDPLLDKEVVRVVSTSPVWTPGRQDGKSVNVQFTLPVTFALSEKKKEPAQQDTTDSETGEPIFYVVEQMPRFQGSDDITAFHHYVTENLVYPEEALRKGISGTVYISFVVDKEGNVQNVKMERGIPEFEKEAIRVVNSSPKWEPGIQRGHKVNVAFTVPVTFLLPANWEKQPLPADIQQPDDPVFFVVEEMPKFQGSDFSTFRQYLAEHIVYPDEAKKKSISGTVYVQMVVTREGTVDHVKVIRGADPLLDKEALRVVMSSPEWEPGKQKGQNVNVAFTFPVVFTLAE